VLAHSEARIVIVEAAAQAAKVEAIRDHCPALEHVIVMDGRADGAVTLRDVRAQRAGAGGPVPARPRGGRTGRCGHDRLHVGHDWADEGLRRHARQPALRRPHV
jgi:hypothetical protein